METGYLNSVNLNRNTNFPYLVLNVENERAEPRNPGFQVMHWHEDLQFIYVLAGEIEVVGLETRAALNAGEGAFINKNVVHLVRKIDSCRYNSFIFPDYFLKFYPDSPAESAVNSLVGREDFAIYAIRNQPENRTVLDALRKLAALESRKTPLYPYEALVNLCALWLEFRRSVALPDAKTVQSALSERTAVFLRYIARHYGEPITLESIAESAHVNKSECLRCFKASLQTAPYQYLTEYRLSRAAEFLRATDDPIGEIASRVGYPQTSHFGKAFREKTGVSPSEYRKQHRKSAED